MLDALHVLLPVPSRRRAVVSAVVKQEQLREHVPVRTAGGLPSLQHSWLFGSGAEFSALQLP